MRNRNHDRDTLIGVQARMAFEAAQQAGEIKLQPLDSAEEAADEPWSVTHVDWSPQDRLLEMRLSASEHQLMQIARRHLFCIYIKHQNQQFVSAPLEVVFAQPGEESLSLRLPFPQAFTKVFHREFFRVYIAGKLDIRLRLSLPQGVLSGQLLDISAGGCQAGIPFQAALYLLQPLSSKLQGQLLFPQGEEANVDLEISYIQPSEDFSQALLGCHFLHSDPDAEKNFFHYTLEAEREIARLSHPDQTRLKPSTLFTPAATPRPQPSSAAPAPVARKKRGDLMTAKQAEKLKGYADELAGQALLLAAGKSLDSSRLRNLAEAYLSHLDNREAELLLTLEQPHPGIHPVILHTLRVTARCYPLVFRLGINRSYDLPVLVALLLHDLGKLFIGSRPCLNPLKVTADQQRKKLLRRFKSQLVQLLRSAEELNWIPKALGESLIVNANERLDGSGYPRGLTGRKLDPLSRLLEVVKLLDCQVRGYGSSPLSWQQAYQTVIAQGNRFDRDALDTFVGYHGLRPIGSQVAFASGHQGCVAGVSSSGRIEEVLVLKSPEASSEQPGDKLTTTDLERLGGLVENKSPLG
ncbi:HD domain-containing phosphohydrolase [Marinospirillum perlucidum]|uniref:HD domain-containing phosphohydrolase n=1 Tax=Marinospirillum perlucidum TaxID=1982602 RepID=UPI000DF22AFF|nr:HD domain-containing phosphohydrolase [Marinospirillum perlucidum]